MSCSALCLSAPDKMKCIAPGGIDARVPARTPAVIVARISSSGMPCAFNLPYSANAVGTSPLERKLASLQLAWNPGAGPSGLHTNEFVPWRSTRRFPASSVTTTVAAVFICSGRGDVASAISASSDCAPASVGAHACQPISSLRP